MRTMIRRKKDIVFFTFSGLFTALLLLWPAAGRAQVSVEASLSRDTILIGDQLDLTLRVIQPAGMEVTMPLFADTVSRGLEVVGHPRTDTLRRKDGRLEITRTWRVTSFDTGGVVLVDPLEVSWERDSVKARLQTRPLQLVVRMLPVETDKGPRDIKDPYKVPLTWQEILLWSVIAAAVILALWLGMRYWKKRKEEKGMPEIRRKPAEPAHVFALRELNTLREARLWQQGKVKEYYTRLTDILRTYLEYRYGIRALEQTTPETLTALEKTGFNDNRLKGILGQILETGDLVKFAKFVPQPDVNESVLLDAFVFVNETKESWKKEEEAEQPAQAGAEGEVTEESVSGGEETAEDQEKNEGKEEQGDV